MSGILEMFNDSNKKSTISSLYKRQSAQKACACKDDKCYDDVLAFINDPSFNLESIRNDISIDIYGTNKRNFYKEMISACKYISGDIVRRMDFDALTPNIATVRRVLNEALRQESDGSIFIALWIWVLSQARKLAYIKQKYGGKESAEMIESLKMSTCDIIGNILYTALVVYAIKIRGDRSLTNVYTSQKETIQQQIASSLDSCLNTYENKPVEDIEDFYSNYILENKDSFVLWNSLIRACGKFPGLEAIVAVNDYVQKGCYKRKLKALKHEAKNPIYNEINRLGGYKSFTQVNEDQDLEYTLKGVACKGANALDELFGNKCGEFKCAAKRFM